MSGAIENRAAVFTSEPQAVEVYQAGAWWAGELLGWRHDSTGACQVWVRVVLGGIEETAWTDLAALRLPERHLSVAATPAPSAPATQEMSVPGGRASRRLPGVDDLAATTGLPVVGERAGRVAPAVRSGGRRRAPEDADVQVVSAASVPVPAGRHRAPAPAGAGRHRAASDTGMFPAVTHDGAPAERRTPSRPSGVQDVRSLPKARSPRVEESFGGGSRDAWGAARDPEPELLTRPMRLSDHVPHSRRPRLDGSLNSA